MKIFALNLKEPVLVRADTERRAREIASMRLGIHVPVGRSDATCPWMNEKMTAAIDVTDMRAEHLDGREGFVQV